MIFFCYLPEQGLTQWDYSYFNFAINYPFSIYQSNYTYPYSLISLYNSQMGQAFNFKKNLLQGKNSGLFQIYSSIFSFNNIPTNLDLTQRARFGNNFSNPLISSNMLALNSPLMDPFQSNAVFSAFNNLFVDPMQSIGVFSGNTSMTESMLPVFYMFSQMDDTDSTVQNNQQETDVNMAKDALTVEVLALAGVLSQNLLTLAEHMGTQMEQFQTMALEIQPQFAYDLEEFVQTAMGWTEEGQNFMETMLPMVASFAEKGMELGAEFAEKGMEFGFEFAIMGEQVGPMANRMLFMATQIGVMADRIGEMADRILFMADNIAEFGDKIIYVSQLIIYTEELMVNTTVLINETIRTVTDMILTMMAIINDNDTYLQLHASMLDRQNVALPLIYENMNKMLDHMLEYSLKVLENEALTRELQLEVRELQIELRESTMSANNCYCPGFCVDPSQCFAWMDPNNQWFDPNQWLDPNNTI